MTPIWRNTNRNSLPGEVWEVCNLAPDYEVSNLGRVKVIIDRLNRNGRHFLKGKIITQNRQNNKKLNNYLRCNLVVDGILKNFSTHRLVALAFVDGFTESRNQVNHKDGVKTNNIYTNLEWTTAKENTKHAHDNGLTSRALGEDNSFAKFTEKDVYNILKLRYVDNLMYKDIALLYDRHPQYIALVATGKRWKHVYEKFMKGEE